MAAAASIDTVDISICPRPGIQISGHTHNTALPLLTNIWLMMELVLVQSPHHTLHNLALSVNLERAAAAACTLHKPWNYIPQQKTFLGWNCVKFRHSAFPDTCRLQNMEIFNIGPIGRGGDTFVSVLPPPPATAAPALVKYNSGSKHELMSHLD